MELKTRVAAIVPKRGSVLLLKHRQGNMSYWTPPGGAAEAGERIHESVKRIVKKRTDVDVKVKRPVYYNDFFGGTKHHMEFFFLCEYRDGEARPLKDTENKKGILEDVRFVEADNLQDYTILPHELKIRLLKDAPRKFKERAVYLD